MEELGLRLQLGSTLLDGFEFLRRLQALLGAAEKLSCSLVALGGFPARPWCGVFIKMTKKNMGGKVECTYGSMNSC